MQTWYVFQDPHVDFHANSELRKLQFYGAGPKMPVPDGKLVKGKIHVNFYTLLELMCRWE